MLTTWLILETLDCRMVTASPMEGFLLTEELKALGPVESKVLLCDNLEMNLDNILYLLNLIF